MPAKRKRQTKKTVEKKNEEPKKLEEWWVNYLNEKGEIAYRPAYIDSSKLPTCRLGVSAMKNPIKHETYEVIKQDG